MNENQSTNRRERRKFSVEEKRTYCMEWKKSGMKRIAFCKANGISKSALYQWNKELTKEHNSAGFSALILKKQPPPQQTDTVQLHIEFSNHLKLNIEIPEHRLVSLIQEIGYAIAVVR